MAPWPEPQGTEPKAPDKSSSENNDATRKDFNSMDEEIECNVSEAIELKSMSNSTEEKQEPPASDVSDLNDGELRALLDEAYNYKSPKDREGKSEIFKKFLEEAETAENEGGPETSLLFAEAPSARASGGKRRSGRREPPVSERQSRCGSLQNLSQCHVEPWPHAPSVSRRSRHGNHLRRGASTSSTCSSATSESVSTRQREGGSLPCSVNAVHDLRTLAGFCGGDDSLTVPSLDDLTSWHSSYSMPRLINQQDKPAVVNTTQVTTTETEQQQQSTTVATVSATVKKPTSPGYETATINKQEMKSELIARVEAVNNEKQKIRERAEEELCERDKEEAPNPKYRSSMEWSINNSKPTAVDEAPDVSYFRLHPTPEGTVLVPSSAGTNLELTEGNAVRSVLGANLNPNRQDAQAKSVVAREGAARKQIYMTSSIQSPPHLYFKDEANATALLQVINTHANKVVVPSSGPKCDDNGNYVGGGADKQGDGSSASQKKKQKKEKGKKMMSHDVEGFKGNEDLDSLLMYIEGEKSREAQSGKPAKQKRNNVHSSREVQQELSSGGRRSHRHSEEGESTSSSKRNKYKDRSDVGDGRVKMKRANSLEEVSRTKLEDLADPTESSRSVGEGRTSQLSMDFEDDMDDIDPRLDEQNGNPSNYKTEFYHSRDNSGFKEDFYSVVEASPQHAEDREEFHVVNNKKQRRKKQRSRQDDRASRHSTSGYQKQNYDEDDDSSILSGFGYRAYRSHHQNDRRKCKSTSSMPPSDQSGGESSDLDSVHSLPVSSTTKKQTIDKTSTSSGSTPQASYADIARMASVNPPPPPPPIQQQPLTSDIPVHNNNKTKNNFNNRNNKNNNSSCTENWETEEWPQVCSNRSVSSVSSQTQQDMPKKDAMTSTFLDVTVTAVTAGAIVTPLQVTATQSTASVASTSSSSSISPPSSTISSSNATEPNTPPEEANRVNVLQDYYPSLEESVNTRRTNLLGDETVCDKRKTDDILRNNSGGEQLNRKSNNNNNNLIDEIKQQNNTEFNNSKEKYIINNKNVNSSASKINSNNIKVIENIPNGDHIELHQKSRSQLAKTNTTASNNTVIYANLFNNNPISTQQPLSSNIIPSTNPSPSSTTTTSTTIQQQQIQQQNMPAVILLNEIQTSDSNSDISGLTFGFEVNDELLSSQNNIVDNSMVVVEPIMSEANNLETIITNSSPLPDPPPNQQQQLNIATNIIVVNTSSHKTKDFAAMYRPIMSNDCSHDKQAGEIVNFVGRAWEQIRSEIGDTTQEHVKCAPVQYYKCNTD